MGHIVDEIVLDLRITFLTEDDEDGEDKGYQQHHREGDGRNHEPHTGKDVGAHIREMYLHHTHLRRRVVAEKRLLIGVLLTFLTIVRTAVYLTAVSSLHPEMIGDVDTVVHQLDLDVTIEHLEVDALL